MDAGLEYRARLAARLSDCRRDEERYRRLGNLRLATAVAGVALAFLVFGGPALPLWSLSVPLFLFIALVTVHAGVAQRLDRSRRSVAFYQRGLARIENRWMGQGASGEQYRDSTHVYADDLDLFGPGSMFELLSTARTRTGEDTLAAWLKAPGEPQVVLQRQAAVREIQPKLDFRESLSLLGDDIRAAVDPDALSRWAEAPPVTFSPLLRPLAFLLAGGTATTLAGWLVLDWPRAPFFAFFLLELLVLLLLHSRMERVLEAVHAPSDDMALLAKMMERIQAEPATSTRLLALQQRLNSEGISAATQIARLERLSTFHDWQHNLFFRPIAAVLLWPVHLAVNIENWRAISGKSVRAWMNTVGEFETLCAFSSYSYEHPADEFPVLSDNPILFAAAGLGHPFLSEATAVRNDVTIDSGTRLLLVSGSNMSGKSTLLRTIGLNAVLAWAGAPVRAHRLHLSRLQVTASIRIHDSLLDGHSRFYSEITRLKQIVELTGQFTSVLFLIDELLSGTNSHDRRIGAEAVVRDLLRRGAAGVITTHDLALVHIAEAVDGQGRNVHFEDTIENGLLSFDYRLRPGVVERSNALELMRSVGLPV